MSSHYLRQLALMLVLTVLGFVGVEASVTPVSPPETVACNFSISPDVHLFPAAGGEVTVNVTAFGTPGDPCGWTTVDGYTWLSLSRVAGNGSGSLKVTVAANNTGAARTAFIQIAGRSFTAFQAANCTYTVSPGTAQMGAQAGQGNINITTSTSSCNWTASESVSWITLPGTKSGMSNGTVPFTVAANTGPARSGTINISTATGILAVTVNQASGCSVSLGYAMRTVAAAGANQSLPVTASNSACQWNATSNAPWITLTSGGQHTGSFNLLYTVAANNGPQRTGTITVGGQTLTVIQLAGCSYSLSPVGRNFNANGGSGVLTVTASNSACQWTAVNNDPWIAITNGTVGVGTDTVVYSVAPNNGAARNGTATIAGKTFSVSQEALATESPILTSLNPAAAFAGSASFTLTVNGDNFNGASRVQWNGADRPTTFVSKTQLQAFIPAPDIAVEGSASVQVRDTAANLVSNSLKFMIFGAVANVSAASFNGEALAPDSMVSAFGVGLATQTALSNGLPLPTLLVGTTVTVRDSQGNEKLAELFFVSPNQINYLMPGGLAEGKAVVTVKNGAGQIRSGSTEIAKVAPGMFTADASGKGLASAIALRVRANGQQVFEQVAQFDPQQQKFVAAAIDLTIPGEQVYLILFGTGFRHLNSLEDVKVRVESLEVEPLYAGESPGLLGMDQINLLLPNQLAGSGDVDVIIKVDGKTANTIKLKFK
ncbi:MAG: BACON domain-containing carbohydrate-binding protein [Acidobacteriota bacterium]|nr:BACON domain-containing carbohydrate-binding protein [Acidobacteriota bacterium]